MSFLIYPNPKMMPFQGLTGFGGGATSLTLGSSGTPGDGTTDKPWRTIYEMSSGENGATQITSAGNYYFQADGYEKVQLKVTSTSSKYWINFPIGTTNDGTNTGALLTSGDWFTKYVSGNQNANSGVHWDGSHRWDSSGSTNTNGGNNSSAWVARIDFGIGLGRYFYAETMCIHSTGAQTADWTQRDGATYTAQDYANSVSNTGMAGYEDGPWLGLERTSDNYVVMPWPNTGNSDQCQNINTSSSPLDLGASNTGTNFSIGICGGIGEHYRWNSGTLFFAGA